MENLIFCAVRQSAFMSCISVTNCYAKKISVGHTNCGVARYLGSYAQISYAIVISESNKEYQFPQSNQT